MIYIFLRGGFANLYFQLAFCAYISNLFDVNVKVLGDNIHPVLKNTFEHFDYIEPTHCGRRINILSFLNSCPLSLLRLMSKVKVFGKGNIFVDPEEPLRANAMIRDLKSYIGIKDVYLYGYWQNFSKEYYLEYTKKFRRECINSLLSIKGDVNSEKSLAIHVRLGDYENWINRLVFRKINDSYYLKWLTFFIQRDNLRSVQVFTNDTSSARFKRMIKNMQRTMPDIRINISSSEDLLTDLVKMSDCEVRIVGNSTFGALSSYVSSAGVTITPQKWFNFRDVVMAIPGSLYVLD